MSSAARTSTWARRSASVMSGVVGAAVAVAARRGGAAASAAWAAAWFHRARKSCEPSPPARALVQQSCSPSGENTGSPSNPSVVVTRTGSRSPIASTR